MRDLLRKLLRVQEIDSRLAQARRDRDDMPARKEQVQSRLADREEAFRRAEAAWKEETLAIKRLEGEADSTRATIQRLRQQQFEVKTNDAYRAMVREIELLGTRLREMEDNELERMERAEELHRALIGTRASLDEERRRVENECAELDRRAVALSADIERMEAERAAAAADVPAEWMSRYVRIRDHVGGLAVAPVEHGTCGGCHMRLPPQVVHDARRADAVVVCTYCGRMLYCSDGLT